MEAKENVILTETTTTDTPRTAANVDPAEGVEASLWSSAARWRSYLCERSVVFRALQEERERGWRSSALDAWYARRQAPAAQSSSTHGTMKSTDASTTERRTATGPAGVEAVTSASAASTCAVTSPTAAAGGTTSFVDADVVVLAERYRQHARSVTQLAASCFFRRSPRSAEPPLFLDLGCAPGGVSKYLLEDLKWRGVGVTLASASGGIEVDPALLGEDHRRHDYLLLDGDVTQPPASWHRSAAYAQLASHNATVHDRTPQAPDTVTAAAVLSVDIFQTASPALPMFHFVNGGAVLDHGQRQRWAKEVEECVSSPAPSIDAVNPPNVSASLPTTTVAALPAAGVSPRNFSVPVLPWFTLLVPQLKAALTYVADGGAIMLVHGAPHCASLFILLRCMEEIVGAANSAACHRGCQTRLLETMYLAKPPLYVLWTDVWSPTAASTGTPFGPTKESSREAQRRLLESLDSASPRVSPFEQNNAPSDAHTGAPRSTSCTRNTLEEKQRFWLGESDEGFRLAVEGFARYGALAEAIWSRVEAFLRRRRERAEREMTTRTTQHSGREVNGRRGRSTLGAGKRMRGDA
ncbi:putative mitochondrial hypothetical protein [Leptomonas pyrrhocoris]|uniref:Ribosomal RNA methyltransferase FtsJ domain-containing protein n=1 Tax=Leptomonas pyrrhocoris TaxID=157538 RepID=A0A0M9FQR1_LEPPY|nr:putative mitochondrial hypothetical protein [Leptomonas pyrrhocoris]KPA74155.1 putative mitochondrial hypothetical protein [Leptomonas pyrrhocoris]|eukprot:XP_015652594.1 putative mitochondrial hypothetical protein [Leptomonas pyrrhocoris]